MHLDVRFAYNAQLQAVFVNLPKPVVNTQYVMALAFPSHQAIVLLRLEAYAINQFDRAWSNQNGFAVNEYPVSGQ